MSRAERTELAQIVRINARVAKDAISARAADLLADFEQQLATRYRIDDPFWQDATAEAQAAVRAADEHIVRLFHEGGKPEAFRPGISLSWWDRGENAMAARRAELRKLATTRLDAMAK